jgi:hypothetical protein
MAADRLAAGPVANLDFVHPKAKRPTLPTYLVAGQHARRTPQFVAQWAEFGTSFDPVASFDYSPSDLVLLDHYDPRSISETRRPSEKLELFRVK